ncbi:MAG: hypothetical protein J07HQW1_02442 [Haloquadratum walsbyi J07HQW1]|jgi:hypothetical protein|uniref:Uncharacterized protein n=1 Tax=Haloquadratum walsbyi J07HQW1 TaxID=1238424 RepID=U1MQT1_9EURY|nr:MAG: hypothetical protein J07HQW1_02442 [Haloquadratum walsbyi J07HQW1]
MSLRGLGADTKAYQRRQEVPIVGVQRTLKPDQVQDRLCQDCS